MNPDGKPFALPVGVRSITLAKIFCVAAFHLFAPKGRRVG